MKNAESLETMKERPLYDIVSIHTKSCNDIQCHAMTNVDNLLLSII